MKNVRYSIISTLIIGFILAQTRPKDVRNAGTVAVFLFLYVYLVYSL